LRTNLIGPKLGFAVWNGLQVFELAHAITFIDKRYQGIKGFLFMDKLKRAKIGDLFIGKQKRELAALTYEKFCDNCTKST
jgi:hypothetical protein